MKGHLLCESYRQGKFEVEERQARRILASPLTHYLPFPHSFSFGDEEGRQVSLCSLSLAWNWAYEWMLSNEKIEYGDLFQMMGQSKSVGFKEREGSRAVEWNTNEPVASSCWRTWLFCCRRWRDMEEFKQEDSFECVSLCMYMYIFMNVNMYIFKYTAMYTSYGYTCTSSCIYVCPYKFLFICVCVYI